MLPWIRGGRERYPSAQLSPLAQPPPPKPCPGVVLLLVPAVAKTDQRPRRRSIELLDGHARSGGRLDRHMHERAIARSRHCERHPDELEDRPCCPRAAPDPLPLDSHRHPRFLPGVEASPADQHPSTEHAAIDPAVNRRG